MKIRSRLAVCSRPDEAHRLHGKWLAGGCERGRFEARSTPARDLMSSGTSATARSWPGAAADPIPPCRADRALVDADVADDVSSTAAATATRPRTPPTNHNTPPGTAGRPANRHHVEPGPPTRPSDADVAHDLSSTGAAAATRRGLARELNAPPGTAERPATATTWSRPTNATGRRRRRPRRQLNRRRNSNPGRRPPRHARHGTTPHRSRGTALVDADVAHDVSSTGAATATPAADLRATPGTARRLTGRAEPPPVDADVGHDVSSTGAATATRPQTSAPRQARQDAAAVACSTRRHQLRT